MNQVVHGWHQFPSLGSVQAGLNDQAASRNVSVIASGNVEPVVAGCAGIDGAFPWKGALHFSSRHPWLGDTVGVFRVSFLLSLSEAGEEECKEQHQDKVVENPKNDDDL